MEKGRHAPGIPSIGERMYHNIVQVALEDIKSSDLTALHPAVILKNEDGQPIITGRVL